MEGIDFNALFQMAPAVVVCLWIVYRQQMQIERLEERCLIKSKECEQSKEDKDVSRAP